MVRRKGHSRGGNLLGSVEKISKAGVLLAPTIRALTMPQDKLGHWLLFNTGMTRNGEWHPEYLKQSAIPIIATFVGWKAFHKLNALIRRI